MTLVTTTLAGTTTGDFSLSGGAETTFCFLRGESGRKLLKLKSYHKQCHVNFYINWLMIVTIELVKENLYHLNYRLKIAQFLYSVRVTYCEWNGTTKILSRRHVKKEKNLKVGRVVRNCNI